MLHVRHDGLHLAPHGFELPAEVLDLAAQVLHLGLQRLRPGHAAPSPLFGRRQLRGAGRHPRGLNGATLVEHRRLEVDPRILQVEALEHGHEERVQGREVDGAHLRSADGEVGQLPEGDRGGRRRGRHRAPSRAALPALLLAPPPGPFRAPERPRGAPAPGFSRAGHQSRSGASLEDGEVAPGHWASHSSLPGNPGPGTAEPLPSARRHPITELELGSAVSRQLADVWNEVRGPVRCPVVGAPTRIRGIPRKNAPRGELASARRPAGP